MKYLRNRFIAGLLILLPAVVTAWVLWKVFTSVDSIIAPIQVRYPIIDIPGIGFLVVLLIVLLTGIFAGNFIGRRVIQRGELFLFKLPLIRRIYAAVKELAEVFLSDRTTVFREVVIVRYPHRDAYVIGFVTAKGTDRLNTIIGRDLVHVFVPTTPNPTSGFLLLLPVDDVIRVAVSVEDALKMVISGGAYIPAPFQNDTGERLPG